MKNTEKIREDFPILSTTVHGHPLIYLDNAATMQVSRQVTEAVCEYYRSCNANVHRGVYFLSEQATTQMEHTRRVVADFIGAAESAEIIFTAGTTASINLVALSFSETFLNCGDTVLTTEMEHHSNLIPWQEVCRRRGAELNVIPITSAGELDMKEFERLLLSHPKIVAITCVSNVTGIINLYEKITRLCHNAGAAVLLDGAQIMRHEKIDVKKIDCDFFCFSGHKIGSPNGIGILYGKRSWLEKLPPVFFGGGMVNEVCKSSATYDELPFKFEAGTPNISGIIGLEAALQYLMGIGLEEIYKREKKLITYLENSLLNTDNIDIMGSPKIRAGSISFRIKDFSSYDAAKLLDQLGIEVRSGHHCAKLLFKHFGWEDAVRISPAFYNTEEEIDYLITGLNRIALLKGSL